MSLFSRLSAVSRRQKLEIFYNLCKPAKQSRALDVGGEAGTGHYTDIRFVDSYPWKEKLVVVNISQSALNRVQNRYPQVQLVCADARYLPFASRSFDVVHSNAVIEHVGDLRDQVQMGREIQRVGVSWFVATPNRWYPFEFHLRLPFVTWIPFHGYRLVGRIFWYNHVVGKYVVKLIKSPPLRLLSCRELATCLPGSMVLKLRITFAPESLIAVGGRISQDDLANLAGSTPAVKGTGKIYVRDRRDL